MWTSLSNAARQRWAAAKRIPRFGISLALAGATIALGVILQQAGGPDYPREVAAKTWALFLQVLGGAIVWRDLAAAATDAGHEGLTRGVLRALRELVRPQPVTLLGGGSAVVSVSGTGRMRQREAVDPAKPLEERVAVLESNQARIDEDLDGLGRELDTHRRETDQRIKAEAAARQQEVAQLQEKADTRVRANYAQLVFGACWALAGTALSTYVCEFAATCR
jgi:hypothetical protein